MSIVVRRIIFSVVFLFAGVSTGTAQDNSAKMTGGNHDGKVSRAQFTREVIDREPVDSILMLKNDADKIYYFSELVNLKGQRVVHRWKYAGRIMAEIEFNVTSNRWRAYSSKKLSPQLLGEWSVIVLDDKGWPLKTSLFEYGEKTIVE